jgi:beta-mannanase
MKSSMRLARPRAATVSISVIAALALTTGIAAPSVGAARTAATAKPAAAVQNVCKKSAIDVPACGVLWGDFTPSENYSSLEASMGRHFDVVKDYMDWKAGVTFPSAKAQALAVGGARTLYFSWNAIDYTTRAKISYQSIANGNWDSSVILPEARALIAFHQKVFLDFNHEFDNKAQATGQGTPAQYVAAYRHIHQVFAAAGVTNVIWVWVSTGFVPHAATIAAGYPGASFVDWVGYDPYNWAACHSAGWQTPQQVFQPFYNWVQTQPTMAAKPLMLTEYASAPGSAVQAWYSGVPAALQQLPKIKAVLQWNWMTSSVCDFRLTSSAAALAGFKTASNNAYITGAAG